ncbi:hypothetical protein, partial [Rubrimonas sp.]|uniref:hypothetical protein n=1 Tax=Rubrimonas sp. TaxID=2036015 RepID=UPI003FA7CB45
MTPPPTLLAIATTGGPAVVRAFWFDAEAARSQIVRFDESHIPMGVDAQFAGFDALLRRRLRAQGAAIPSEPLILEVEGDVDAGASWQLGLATAHLLAAAGALVFDAAQAERRLLATGRLGTSAWDVKPVDGLEEKLAGAAAFLTPAPDCSTGFVLPQPMAAAAARAAPPGAQVVGLETLDALARALGAAPTPTAAAPARTGERRAALLGAALLAAAAGAFALRDAVAPRAPDVVAPRAPDVAALGAPDLAALGATADAAPEAPPDAR